MGSALSRPESPEFFTISTDTELAARQIFGSDYQWVIENTLINQVTAYKTSHRDEYTSMTPRKYFKNRYYTPENFHSFVVLRTDKGIFLSLEKQDSTDI